MRKNINKIVEGFFDSLCNVISFVEYTDEYGILQHSQKTVLKDIPCRVCYKSINSAATGKAADYITQKVILMVARDINIENGSLINVTKNGQTVAYQKTGEAALYDSHREIAMLLKDTFS